MRKNSEKQQKLLESMININPNFLIKSKIREIDEQVKERNKNRQLHSPLTIHERILFKH